MKTIFASFLIVFAGVIPAIALAQDEDVRGAFMTTRPKATGSASGNTSGSAARPSRRQPKTPAPAPSPGPAPVGPKRPDTPSKVNLPRIGLGLTLFMRDSNGLSVRTDPSHEFHKGDHVRILIETNADGYLYVFNTTDNGPAMMLYPDPELDEAGNYFQAHVPFEIPSSLAAEERLRWLTFDDNAGAEKLYFVFTREPLAAVPIEDDLIAFCRENKGKCPWSPGAEVWTQIQKETSEPVQSAKAGGMGSAQTTSEVRAATRGIGLNRDDPEPSLIMLSGSTSKNMLVVTLDLVHKSLSMAADSNDEMP
ncbi:MAG: DUF4384 domain-containing protein [Pyrinomonadaceae bacterium]